MPKVEISCKECGKIFIEYLCKGKMFCGFVCSNTFKNRIRSQNAPRQKICCGFCGKNYLILQGHFDSKRGYKFCSIKCRNLIKRRKEKNCIYCKKEFYPNNNNQIFCGNRCSALKKNLDLGRNKKRWMENGYWVLYIRNEKPIKEHIKIMQDFLGRKLEKCEVVHHINQIPTDNRLENLQVMTRSDHTKLHRKMLKDLKS
jgi:hypothetical protein